MVTWNDEIFVDDLLPEVEKKATFREVDGKIIALLSELDQIIVDVNFSPASPPMAYRSQNETCDTAPNLAKNSHKQKSSGTVFSSPSL